MTQYTIDRNTINKAIARETAFVFGNGGCVINVVFDFIVTDDATVGLQIRIKAALWDKPVYYLVRQYKLTGDPEHPLKRGYGDSYDEDEAKAIGLEF